MKITKALPYSFDVRSKSVNTKNMFLHTNEKTNIHNHHDKECWYIKSGKGIVRNGDTTAVLEAGDYIEFSLFEPHTIENRSSENLCFTAYWYADWAEVLAEANKDSQYSSKLLIQTAFPTPNGPLHLGHLSGAYLISDIHRRCCELKGIETFSFCGTFGHTNHIDRSAEVQALSYNELASRSEQKIINNLEMFQTRYDAFLTHFSTLTSGSFNTSTTKFIEVLMSSSYLDEREVLHPYSDSYGDFVSESYVSGGCPNCGEITIGMECESCGLYQDECELIDPFHSVTKEKLTHRPIKRLYLTLDREIITELLATCYSNNVAMGRTSFDGFKGYLENNSLTDIAVTSIRRNGISIYGDQKLSVIMERALRTYHAISLFPEAERHVFFCGKDNMCGTAIFLPYILKVLGVPDKQIPISVITNFCLLEGRKFSTSAGHAIWASEFLNSYPADLLRLYLSGIQNQTFESRFSVGEFHESSRNFINTVGDIFSQGSDLATQYDGAAEAGPWLKQDVAFYRELNEAMRHCINSYTDCALKSSIKRISYIIDVIRDYIEESTRYSGDKNYLRTRIALTNYAYKCLGYCLYPVTPKIATKILACFEIGPEDYQSKGIQVQVVTALDLDPVFHELNNMKVMMEA
ncbi:class I tRNA ligase family protein [Photobacterium sp. Hal280]|uniref:class I tRNA ligase family protein n=1 Tax=Photobacterium sp. Hal280 TaxID=3035163 RepID=UPI00301D3C40